MLSVKNLQVQVEGKEILHGIDLQIKPGEVHAIMGPNGSGKSTFSNVLMGHSKYKVTNGEIEFRGQNLLELEPEERARLGMFLAFQYPKEIPGVSLVSFLRAAYNAVRKDKDPISLYHFKKLLEEKMELIGLSSTFMSRSLNEGFSGGEKKKVEILQMAMLEPRLAILDETDSGLDIDALKTICETVQAIRSPKQSILLITHYPRILDYITPDKVHVLMNGKIVMEDGERLARKLEEQGYDYVREKMGIKSLGLKIVN
ncbi:Fe-S cluster assembly ATPase SufC [Candidatus Peregrinibacteria bacterium]|jgi:Fe-S cluster assembly ATP-binding protein|nr:Fe-S cluster assembly ATPase SufC [Candidatus Peregrinibacteria bacterium]MBT7484323.1 Fe-S cluster assembly ATPase SufC [Candidatus Peregrinibacteria bacterium]MBT7702748.1 Fe-S cluster assembly ATPase SufC [Candidatus Peregrinibacteria bacterium]